MSTWLGVIGLAIPVAGMAAATPRMLPRLDRHWRHEPSIAHARAADRAALLSRVRDKWIDGVLVPSLAHTERLPLDLVRNGRNVTKTPVLQLFLRTGGGLLIHGAPGGGKTTLLLELADGLLERAESDAGQPVPVVASLASWAGQHQQLDQWLAGELAESYRIPAAAATDWATRNDLVLLLDGLDEVAERHRDSCAEAINCFLRDRPFARLAVCCRTETAQARRTELALPQRVELRPAGQAQVDSYLARLETTWTPLPDLRTALVADERLRVPLMLKIAALANRGRTPPGNAGRPPGRGGRLPAPEWPQEIAEIFAPEPPRSAWQAPVDPATIWAAYIARMLAPRSLWRGSGQDYQETTARSSLTWLAARLHDTGKDEFQLDHLALDSRLQQTREARQLRRLIRHAAASTDRQIHTTALDLARWLESRGPMGTRTANRLRDNASRIRPGAWLRQLPAAITRPAPETGWLPDSRPAVLPSLVVVFALPAITVIAASVGGWPLALPAALACGLLWGVNLPARLGLRPRPRRPRTVPNEAIRRSARHASVATIAAAAGSGIGLALLNSLANDLATPAIALAALLIGAGAAVSTGAGACVNHYAARLRLARAGVIPWRYRTFLDAMTERNLLYRSGGDYRFIHRLLADYLTNPGGNIGNSPAALAQTEVIPVALSHEPAYRTDQPSPQRVSHRAQQPAGRHSAGAG
jgi:hypothetical protein